MRILITGSRNYDDKHRIWMELEALKAHDDKLEIVHGGAPGADKLADEAALQLGIDRIIFPANWKKYGQAAGPRRNEKMLKTAKPKLVIAFVKGRLENSKGTRNTVEQARELGIETRVIEELHGKSNIL